MLTYADCRSAKCPSDKGRVRFTDGGGLYLEARPNGGRYWYWKYLAGGKEKRLALGVYPQVPLKKARSERDKARLTLKDGIDPAQKRRADKLSSRANAATTYEAVAREFHSTKADGWSEGHTKRWLLRQEQDVFPWIGTLPISAVTAPLLLQVLRRIEARGAIETAHTIMQCCGQVFRYGIQVGQCERNPAPDLRGALGSEPGSGARLERVPTRSDSLHGCAGLR